MYNRRNFIKSATLFSIFAPTLIKPNWKFATPMWLECFDEYGRMRQWRGDLDVIKKGSELCFSSIDAPDWIGVRDRREFIVNRIKKVYRHEFREIV